ncbi:MAG: hypothetical protein PG981_000880 [Wolbachia endosymbiont of Ctenocephalides orientis wCori]|nr:MAG: hypothetical protein PG981_000880 [Wolbachia endosymbiont of Ctenocephalides orientis wCori]
MLEKLSSKDLQKLVNRTQGSVLHKIYENRDGLTSDELVISKYAQNAFKGKDFSKDSTSSDECPMTLMPISERVWLMYNNNEVSKYPFEGEAIERWYKAKGHVQ